MSIIVIHSFKFARAKLSLCICVFSCSHLFSAFYGFITPFAVIFFIPIYMYIYIGYIGCIFCIYINLYIYSYIFRLSARFLMGGFYYICYCDEGTCEPGHADLVPFRIEVYGVYDSRAECREGGRLWSEEMVALRAFI